MMTVCELEMRNAGGKATAHGLRQKVHTRLLPVEPGVLQVLQLNGSLCFTSIELCNLVPGDYTKYLIGRVCHRDPGRYATEKPRGVSNAEKRENMKDD